MHPRPWPNIPRDAIKQNSKINIAFIFATYLASFLERISCDENTASLTFSLISFIEHTSPCQVAGTMGWLGQSARWRGGSGGIFEDTLQGGAALTIYDRSSAARPAGLLAE